jgi:hypothetical protein
LAEGIGEALELQPLSNAAIALRMTANADAAYKTIGKLAGLRHAPNWVRSANWKERQVRGVNGLGMEASWGPDTPGPAQPWRAGSCVTATVERASSLPCRHPCRHSSRRGRRRRPDFPCRMCRDIAPPFFSHQEFDFFSH